MYQSSSDGGSFRRRRSRLRQAVGAALLLTGLLPMSSTAQAAAPERQPASQERQSAVLDTTATTPSADEVEKLLAKAKAEGSVRVIVGLKARFDPVDAAEAETAAEQADRLRPVRQGVLDVLQRHDVEVLHTYEGLPYVAVNASHGALVALRASGRAASITEDVLLFPTLADSTRIVESVPQVERGWSGGNRVVAVLDSGVETTHPFLAGRIVDEACFSHNATCPNGQTVQKGPGAGAPCPADCSHGTHVAGIAAGKRAAGGTFDGVAPGARIMPIQVMSVYRGAACGAGLPPTATCTATALSDQIEAMRWILERANAGLPVASVNMSFGGGTSTTNCDDHPLKASVDALRVKNIATIASSGNGGLTNGVSAPACISSVIAVGATTKADAVASYSNSSPMVRLLAPGSGIASSVIGGGYGEMGGTSMAAPHVAGAWAAYTHRFPNASVDDVLAALRRGGRPIRDARNGVTVPRLNVTAAMTRYGYVIASNPTAASYTPSVRVNSVGGTNTVSRTGVGAYTVNLPNLGDGLYGNTMVREYAINGNRCKLAMVGSAGATTNLHVRCTTPAGAPVDERFIAEFHVDEALKTRRTAYVTALDPKAASYDVSPLLSSNPTGARNHVTRTATGKYTVKFRGLTGDNANPQVNAMGGDGNTCQVVFWTAGDVYVACHTAAGAPVDSMFQLRYTDRSVYTGARGAYVAATQPSSTVAYPADPNYSWNSSGGANTIRRTGTGNYEVRMANQPTATGLPMVSALDSAAARNCRPVLWSTGGADAVVNVQCRNAAGTLVDSRFTLSWSTATP